jgi:GNAT superfamily N-acetyltransferase
VRLSDRRANSASDAGPISTCAITVRSRTLLETRRGGSRSAAAGHPQRATLCAVDVKVGRFQPDLECLLDLRPVAIGDRVPGGGVAATAPIDHPSPRTCSTVTVVRADPPRSELTPLPPGRWFEGRLTTASSGQIPMSTSKPPTEERRDRSPWLLGMIVRRDRRGAGIGSLLLARLERWAYSQGYELLLVATGGVAAGFYQRCGWRIYETVDRDFEPATVLTKEPRAEPM